MSYKLIAQKGPSSGTAYTLEQQEIFMGRDLSNDVVVNDPEISRRHARLYKQGERYVIEDLGSTNGTIVNGQRIRGPLQLSNQDHITIGQNIAFVFLDERAPVPNDATVAADAFNPLAIESTMLASDNDPFEISTPPAFTPPTPHIPTEFSQTPEFTTQDDAMPPQWQAKPMQQIPSGSKSGSEGRKPNPAGKKKFPIWLIVVVILLLVACLCVGGLVVIDYLDMWCDILPFIPGCSIG